MFYISKCKNFLSNVRYQPNVLVTISQSENWHVALWSFVGIDRFTPSKIKLNVVGFSISPNFVRVFFLSQLLFVNLNPVCWKNEGSSRPGSSGANCLKFFLLAKVFCNALQNSGRIALLALDVLCGLDTAGGFNEVLVCWRICLSHWLQGDFHPRSLFV